LHYSVDQVYTLTPTTISLEIEDVDASVDCSATPVDPTSIVEPPLAYLDPCPAVEELSASIKNVVVTQEPREDAPSYDNRVTTTMQGIVRVENPTDKPATYRYGIRAYRDEALMRIVKVAGDGDRDLTVDPGQVHELPIETRIHLDGQRDNLDDHYRFQLVNEGVFFECGT
jgi:hypothetical protein